MSSIGSISSLSTLFSFQATNGSQNLSVSGTELQQVRRDNSGQIDTIQDIVSLSGDLTNSSGAHAKANVTIHATSVAVLKLDGSSGWLTTVSDDARGTSSYFSSDNTQNTQNTYQYHAIASINSATSSDISAVIAKEVADSIHPSVTQTQYTSILPTLNQYNAYYDKTEYQRQVTNSLLA